MRDEKLEVRRERLEAIGFTDDSEKERFYAAGDGFFFELEYDIAADFNAVDFKAYLEKTAAEIQAAKNKPQEATPEDVPAENLKLDDWESLTDYIENIMLVELPTLQHEEANNILAEFKNDMKRAVEKAVNNIKVFTHE